MGRDCSLFIFPPGRAPRRCGLDRWSYLIPVYAALGVKGWYEDRVPAHQMLAALETLPSWDSPDRPDLMENAAHWRAMAVEYLRMATKRWGVDVPTMICDEEFDWRDYAPRAVVERLDRQKKYRDSRKRVAKEHEDRQQGVIVQVWLSERRKR